jgi:hypothetical protein
MPDIHCRRCREPWDLFGIPHSAGGYGNDEDYDMTVEEAQKMMRGEGCPCCIGKEVPKEQTEAALEATLGDVLEHEDPDTLIEEMGL